MGDLSMGDVWRVKATDGRGWLREMYRGGPLVTGDVREAQQFATQAQALRVLATIARDRVPMAPVKGPATEAYERGAP